MSVTRISAVMSSEADPARKRNHEELLDVIQRTMALNSDVLAFQIFPFVGPGQFAFVAFVCRNFRDSYKKYVSSIATPPLVIARRFHDDTRPATSTDTFYRAVFETVSRAEYWVANGGDTTTVACEQAARIGNLPLLKWATEKGYYCGQCAFTAAAKGGHLEILKWALENGCRRNWQECISAAETNGHSEVLNWARLQERYEKSLVSEKEQFLKSRHRQQVLQRRQQQKQRAREHRARNNNNNY